MLEYQEVYLNYLKSLKYSDKTIEKRKLCFKQFENYLKITNKENNIKNYTKKIFEDFYIYLTEYKYKIADNRESGYIKDKTKRRYVKKKLSLLTILSKMSGLKDYIKYLVEHGKMYKNPFENIEFPKYQDKLKEDITESDMEKLVNAIETDNFLGFRDRTIIEVFYSTGIRRDELRKLSIYDIDFNDKILKIREGKNKKDRSVPLGEVASSYLKEYIIKVRKYLLSINNMFNDALFVSNKGNRLTNESISRIIRFYSRKAGVEITTHKLRHAFALHMLRKGCDIRSIQDILGHEYLETTTIYTQVFDNDLKNKILSCHPRDFELDEKVDIGEIIRICKKSKKVL